MLKNSLFKSHALSKFFISILVIILAASSIWLPLSYFLPTAHATSPPPPPTTASYFSDQATTIVSSSSAGMVLHKELKGAGGYGASDGAVDILYTGQAATWHFALPSSLDPITVKTASFRASIILDDHYSNPVNDYILAAWTNGNFLSNQPANLPHGTPYGSVFTNWAQQNFTASTGGSTYTITLQNNSTLLSGGDWVAVDWIELSLNTCTGSCIQGILGHYWIGSSFPTTPPDRSRIDANISFATQYGYSWHPFGYGDFSVIWNGTITAPTSGVYGFALNSDDGSWLYIDGTLLVNDGGVHGPQTVTATTTLTMGSHGIVVMFSECCGGQSGVDLYWTPPGSTGFTIVPSSAFGFTPSTGPLAHRLNVKVIDSTTSPIQGATVSVSTNTVLTSMLGYASVVLPTGTYNVTALHAGYTSASTIVTLDRNQTIMLTLARPYAFQGEIPDSNIRISEVTVGFNITLLNLFQSSASDIFLDWKHVGALSAGGSWQAFIIDHLPNLVVMAAAPGTSDYPKAWSKNPLPVGLPPTTGTEGAFLPEPVPYASASIFSIPDPLAFGRNATLGVRLHNPFTTPLHLSRVDFQFSGSGLTVGGFFDSIGYASNITLAPGENRNVTVTWLVNISGHHCLRVVISYSPQSQTLQRNFDIQSNLTAGGSSDHTLILRNPEPTRQCITVAITEILFPTGWTEQVYVNGQLVTGSSFVVCLAGGAEVPILVVINTDPNNPGIGTKDVSASINGQSIGGVRIIVTTMSGSSGGGGGGGGGGGNRQTNTSVVCNPAVVHSNAPTTCTATVTGSNSPTGTVTFTSISSTGTFGPENGQCDLSSDGTCSVDYTDTTLGSSTITASYLGDSNNDQSQGSTDVKVIRSYRIDLKAWIPQPIVVDPVIPLPEPYYLALVESQCYAPPLSQIATTAVTSNYLGDNHQVFDGTYRVLASAQFDWDGRTIDHFVESSDPMFGQTTRFMTYVTGLRNPTIISCTVSGTQTNTVTVQQTGRASFTLGYSTGNPLVPFQYFVPKIDATVDGTISSDGTMALNYQTDSFPSHGIRVIADGSVQATDIVSDARCLSNSAVLGPGGALTLTVGLTSLAQLGTMYVYPTDSGTFMTRDSLLCSQNPTHASTTTTIQGGGAFVDQTAQTGVSLNISGATAPQFAAAISSPANGIVVTVNSTVLSGIPNVSFTGNSLDTIGFFDVKIVGITAGTATVCFTTPFLPVLASLPVPAMQYWNGANWATAAKISFSSSTPKICGDIPVSALNGTPIAIGNNRAQLSDFVFFTDADQNPLPTDSSGKSKVDVVIASGKVSATNPGQIIAWTNATNTGLTSLQSIQLTETLPADWQASPAWLPSKGAIHVYFVYTNGTRIEITDLGSITVSNTNPEILTLNIPNLNATIAGRPLKPGESILVSVQLAYSLKGTSQSGTTYPRVYADSTGVIGWTLSLYTGGQTVPSSSGSITAYAKVVGDVNGDGKVNILDLSMVGSAFGSKLGDPRYNPLADLNNDGRIDILDLSIVGSNFGS